nr:hypothetical protein [Bacillus tequilensis]
MAKQMMIAAMPTAANTIFLLEKEEAYSFRGLLTLTRPGFILKAGKSSPRNYIRKGLFQLNWHFSER